MSAIPKGSLVLISGLNGYVASHVADQLLQRGFRVRGTVRDAYKAEYMLEYFRGKYGNNLIEIRIVPDMAADHAFDEVARDCTGIVHLATDLTLNPDPNIVIPMVVSGARNAMLAASSTPGVKRFVYTSSASACTAPIPNKRIHIDANTWNEDDFDAAWAPTPYTGHERKLSVYRASKTLAERECWRYMEDSKPGFVLNTVLPNCVIGKILCSKQPASTGGWYKKLWDGDQDTLSLLRDLFAPQHYVNATDTALLHVAALLEEDVVGERLLAFAAPFNFNDTVELLEQLDTTGTRRWERIPNAAKDLMTVDTARSQELLRRYGRPCWTDLKTSLKEAIDS